MRYVIVSTDPADKVIRGGPLEWDGVTAYQPPPGTQLITDAVARSGGYTMPARPASEVNETTVRDRLTQALAVDAAWLQIATPTGAQTTAQVQRITRQVSGLIRLALGQLETDDGT